MKLVIDIDEKLKSGKRYSFCQVIGDESTRIDALFTGKYATNGSAILITKWGDEWWVDAKNLREVEK